MRVLGVDPAMATGLCHGEPGGQPVYSLLRVPQISYGGRFSVFARQIRELIKGNGITHVFCEAAYIGRSTAPGKFQMSQEQIDLSAGWKTMMNALCYEEGIESPQFVAPSQWRKVVHDSAQPPKGMDDDQRRAWRKREAIRFCIHQGWNIDDDNVADATCIWLYGCGVLQPEVAINATPLFQMIRP